MKKTLLGVERDNEKAGDRQKETERAREIDRWTEREKKVAL